MASSAAELVYRTEAVLGKYKEWFDAVAQWYDNAKATKKVLVNLWVPADRPTCRLLLSVNGQFVDGGALDKQSQRLFWRTPASTLRVGNNEFVLWIDRQDGPPLSFGAVTVEQAADAAHDARPPAASQVAVVCRLGEEFRPDTDRWTTEIHGETLKFHLHLTHQVSGSFAVNVTALLAGAGQVLNFKVLWELVEDAVKDKIKELAKELVRLEREQSARSRIVKKNLEDLEAYQKLHRTHLAEALKGRDSDTLEDIMARTDEPALAELVPGAKLVPARRRSLSARLVLFLMVVLGAVLLAWLNGWMDMPLLDRAAAAWRNGGQPGIQKEREINQLLQAKGAQTGDVQISLLWPNKNDLDLHVVCPSGERIYWGHRQSKCQGRIDVDMNVVYDKASAKALENVFWPQGQAPRGRYKILVTHFRNHGRPDCQDPTSFTVRAVVRGQTRWFNGQVVSADPARREVLVHEFAVP